MPPAARGQPCKASQGVRTLIAVADLLVDDPARQRQQGSRGPPPLPAADAQAAAGPKDPWLRAMVEQLDALADTRAGLARVQAENGELKQQLQAAQRQLADAAAGHKVLQQRCDQLSATVDEQARQLAEGEAERNRLAQELQQELEGAARLRAQAEEHRGTYGLMVELLKQRGVRPRE